MIILSYRLKSVRVSIFRRQARLFIPLIYFAYYRRAGFDGARARPEKPLPASLAGLTGTRDGHDVRYMRITRWAFVFHFHWRRISYIELFPGRKYAQVSDLRARLTHFRCYWF